MTEVTSSDCLPCVASSAPDGFLTTEKDAVNLGSLQAELKPFAIAELSLTIDHSNDVVDAILARIAERKPHS